ncbi:carbonic anhydrase [Hymenobacter chitinivorans]|uniref:Carbonic anhydrase n=1 Tax=Hymenobacter chitinivorans DSM 11115 TaxID=1121954 RepID=A0A2M9BPA7_9BACT|nr:carbonic anhydrase [Hymenobacter chitinivorans]PJJ59795.1 carbonic anhydrase [Hymenobacter chitinivorans DSM 11115]
MKATPDSSSSMEEILKNNRKWVDEKKAADPEYFHKLAKGQKPRYLFIGCSDSRVPASAITGTGPGEMFVHRNIANLVVHSDMNLLAVLQYAVEVLEVKDILVVGHYGCGGVAAAASNKQLGLIDNWLTHIKDVVRLNETEFLRIADKEQQLRRLVELNVIEQVRNLATTNIIQNALGRPNPPRLHGLVYDIHDGLLHDLNVETDIINEFKHIYGVEAIELAEEAVEDIQAGKQQPAPTEPKPNGKARKEEEEQARKA